MASSDTKNSFARAVALTGRPRCSRLSISPFLIAADEPCINKKLSCTTKKYKKLSFGQPCALQLLLLRLAERADAKDIPAGMSIPEELERRELRLAAITEAKAKIEARAAERLAREQAEHQSKLAHVRDADLLSEQSDHLGEFSINLVSIRAHPGFVHSIESLSTYAIARTDCNALPPNTLPNPDNCADR
jgi:hypothetical protein